MNQFINSLESRRLLAAVSLVPNEYGGQTVVVEGSSKSDVINIVQQTTYVGEDPQNAQKFELSIVHNGKSQFVAMTTDQADKQIRMVLVKAGKGRDIVTVTNLDVSGKGSPMLHVEGGAGNDRIFCRDGFVLAEGGDGNDIIVGSTDKSPPETYLAFSFSGGTGNDTLIGSEYADAFNGNTGNDLILAGAGNDSVQFGEGRDLVDAGLGDDYLTKGYDDMSRATVIGGAGNDTMAVYTWGGQPMPLDTTFSNLKIVGVEEFGIDTKG